MDIPHALRPILWRDPTVNNCNVFLIHGKLNILIDPGHASLFGHVIEALSAEGLSPEKIDLVLITHAHPDHLEGVSRFRGTRALTALHTRERDFFKEFAAYGEAFGLGDFEPSLLLEEGLLKADPWTFRILHTPGHSPGSICIYWEDEEVLFSGDLIFFQGIGRTDLPGGDSQALKESIRKVSPIPTRCLCPGHGEMVVGKDRVAANYEAVEAYWFPYL